MNQSIASFDSGAVGLPLTDQQIDEILHRIEEGVIGLDSEGFCTFANRKALTLLQCKDPSELVGHPISDILNNHSPQCSDSEQCPLCQAIAAKKAVSELPGEIMARDGNRIEVSYWFNPLVQENGHSGSILGIKEAGSLEQNHNFHISLERYRLLIESTQVVLWEFDIQSGFFTFVSPQAERVFGYPLRDWYQSGFWEKLVHPGDREDSFRRCNELSTIFNSYELEYRMLHADGHTIYVHDYISVLRDDNDIPYAMRGVFTDVSQKKQDEERLRVSAIAFESSDAITITDADANIIDVNTAFTRITGYEKQEVIGKNPRILKSGLQKKSFYVELWRDLKERYHWQGEIWNKRKNGEIYPEWLTITAVVDEKGVVNNYVGIFSDISERKKDEDKIKYHESHDALTGLANRVQLVRSIKRSINSATRNGNWGALLLLDLDEFKLINDSLGHRFGDQLLCLVADSLKQKISNGDILARIGGDEFAVLMPEVGGDKKWVEEIVFGFAKGLCKSFSDAISLDGKKIHISTSIGVSFFSAINNSVGDILRQADTAMYRAKESGKNQVCSFSEGMHEEIERRLMIHNDLTVALQQDQLSLNFQPVYNGEGNIVSGEALLRWHHPDEGFISPAEFIPVAEKTGLIIPVGRWVIEQACTILGDWLKREEFSLSSLAINVSSQQFEEDGFYDTLAELIQRYRIPKGMLVLEVTEEVLIGDVEKTIGIFHEIKSLGVSFSIDDFGTGYSSLRYIKELPIDNLKIDQSFIRDIPDDKSDCVLVDTVIAMAKHMSLSVTAEGVETHDQEQFLKERDCDQYQGYLYNKPLPQKEFESLIFKADGAS